MATGFSYDPARRGAQAELVADLVPQVRDIRRAGAAALDLAWLAAGRLDGFFEHGLKRWDWAAGRLIVEEAGGVCRAAARRSPGLAAASGPGCWPLARRARLELCRPLALPNRYCTRASSCFSVSLPS